MKKSKKIFEKEDFHSHLNIEDITDADYPHAKRVCKDFEKKFKKISGYQSHISLLADVFGNFIDMYLDMHELDSAKIFSTTGLTW